MWQPVDIVVLTLAVAVFVSLVVTVTAPIFLKEPLSEERSRLLSALAAAIIAIISVYVGSSLNLTNP